MTLLFASTFDDPAPWLAEITRALPDLETRAYPNVGDLADIRYALVWKPEPGLLASLPNLEVIFSLGAGVDALLVDPTLPPGVPVVRMVDHGLTEGMTEYVVLHVLAWHRQLHAYRSQQSEGHWRPRAELLARERTVGVLGMGTLGSDAATALAALRFPVLGWSRTSKSVPGVQSFAGGTAADGGLAEMLPRCDILVNLLPLTPATLGILNRRLFAALPRGAYLINAARGDHLVEDDLLAALDAGEIAGATLDVFHREPLPPDHPFWRHPKVVVTPHTASVTHARTAAAAVIDGIRRHRAGEPLVNLVDRTRGY